MSPQSVRNEVAAEGFPIEKPLPVLTVRLNGGIDAEQRLFTLIDVLSEQETVLGGSGLEVALQVAGADGIRVTLIPRSVDGARVRMEKMARWAAAFGSEVAVTVV